jgi:serine/threonine-protein kinase
VRFIAWLMLGIMGPGAIIDLGYAKIVQGEVDSILVVSSIVAVAIGAAFLFAAYSPRFTHLTVLRIALAYEVVVCFIMATVLPWVMFDMTGQYPYVTWVTPLIILFPLIVPSPPRITLVTALLAAATRPAGLIILDLTTSMEVDVPMLILSSVSPMFAVGIAYASSRVVHGMNVDLAKAQRLGSYQLESRLGVGGMGEVWRAQHQLLARPAAIKLIRPESLTDDPLRQHVILARFEQEAQATAAMESPHTIQLYDFGIAQSGAFYYVMEYLNGLDLDELVQRFGTVPSSRLVHLLSQMCDSLGEAHEHGLIHRDIKPANIYVCRYGRHYDFAKVLDFGLVKFERDGEEDELRLTTDISVGGTPGFIAPEQALGKEADGRTDIYSLGCTAYWALTGSTVFQGETPMETVMMHVNKPPEPVSSRGKQVIPPDLDKFVLACLEKDPADRPRDVDEVAEMLAACDVGEVWSQEAAKQWWEDNVPASERTEIRRSGSAPRMVDV